MPPLALVSYRQRPPADSARTASRKIQIETAAPLQIIAGTPIVLTGVRQGIDGSYVVRRLEPRVIVRDYGRGWIARGLLAVLLLEALAGLFQNTLEFQIERPAPTE